MRQVDDNFFKDPDVPLYHYTGIDTLLGIAATREFWASHVNYMNDSKELAHACDMMAYIELPNFVFGGAAKQKFLSQFRGWIEKWRSEPFDLFVLSLSEQQSLLSQWRSYTPHGRGVCIGFSTELVGKIAKKNHFRLGRCIYSLPEQCRLIESLIEKLWISWARQELPEQDFPDYCPFFDSYQIEVLQVMALIKHEAFAEEREWRLISNPKIEKRKIFFRQGEGASLLTPYVKLSLFDDNNLFDLVVLGPTPHQRLALHALMIFLKDSKLCGNAFACEIPYREW